MLLLRSSAMLRQLSQTIFILYAHILSQISKGLCDLGTGGWDISSSRYAFADFTRSLNQIEFRYMTTHRKPVPPYENVFLVFHWKVWAATSTAMITVTVVLFALRPIGKDRIHFSGKHHTKVNVELHIYIYQC